MSRIKKLLKDNTGGVSQLIGAIFAMLAIIMVFVALIAGLKILNQYSTLNDFGNQLVQAAGREGQCNGATLDKRYGELVSATGLSPTAEWAATYYNSDDKTVQYGNTITLTLTLKTDLSAVGISIPLNLQVTKTAQSEKYWK